MIPTTRHLQYAQIGLGMVNEASDELEAIDWDDRMNEEVLAVRVDLYSKAKNWELMADVSKHLAENYPKQSDYWMHWAFALKELDKVEEAKAVAVRGLELHPDCALLHFNLACYLSLLGEFEPAKKHLNKACKADDRFKALAVVDEDLVGFWSGLGRRVISSRSNTSAPVGH
jgi:tetratricopeptide (TPR) repeat protein